MIFDFPASELGETNICSLPATQFLVFLLWQPGRLRQGPEKDKLALLLSLPGHGIHSVHLDTHCGVQSGQRFLSLKLKASPPQHLISKRKGGDLGVSPSLSHSPCFLQSPAWGEAWARISFWKLHQWASQPCFLKFSRSLIIQNCSVLLPWPGFQNLWLAKPAKQNSFKIQASPGKWFLMKVVPSLRGHLGKLWGYFWLSQKLGSWRLLALSRWGRGWSTSCNEGGSPKYRWEICL